MTSEQLDALAALVGQMTPGPFRADSLNHIWRTYQNVEGLRCHQPVAEIVMAGGHEAEASANAAGIVAIVNAAPELLWLARKGLEAEPWLSPSEMQALVEEANETVRLHPSAPPAFTSKEACVEEAEHCCRDGGWKPAPPAAGGERTCEQCKHRRTTYDSGTQSPAWCGELTDPTNRNAAVLMCGFVKFCGAFAPRTEEA